jgi:intracellular multiplication protein IcmL
MTDTALEEARERKNYYRDNYRRVVALLVLLITINLILAVIIYYQATTIPDPNYFATSEDGQITALYPVAPPVNSGS